MLKQFFESAEMTIKPIILPEVVFGGTEERIRFENEGNEEFNLKKPCNGTPNELIPSTIRLGLRSTNYITSGGYNYGKTFHEQRFTITYNQTKGVIYKGISHLKFEVLNSSGAAIPISIQINEITRHNFTCTFVPTEAGVYKVGIKLGRQTTAPHITRSPFVFCIYANYSSMKPCIWLSLRLECYNRTRISKKIRFWGISIDECLLRVFVGDRKLNLIHVFACHDKRIVSLGSISLECNIRPTGLAYDKQSGLLYVVDRNHHKICGINDKGEVVKTIGSPGHNDGELWFPWDVAVSSTLVGISDNGNSRVQVFDKLGNWLFKSPRFGEWGYIESPWGIAFNSFGNLIYCSNRHMNSVLAFDLLTGSAKYVVGGCQHLKMPGGLSVDSMNNVIVCNYGQNKLSIFTPDGNSLGSLEFANPSESIILNVCAAGSMIFVLDDYGQLVRVCY